MCTMFTAHRRETKILLTFLCILHMRSQTTGAATWSGRRMSLVSTLTTPTGDTRDITRPQVAVSMRSQNAHLPASTVDHRSTTRLRVLHLPHMRPQTTSLARCCGRQMLLVDMLTTRTMGTRATTIFRGFAQTLGKGKHLRPSAISRRPAKLLCTLHLLCQHTGVLLMIALKQHRQDTMAPREFTSALRQGMGMRAPIIAHWPTTSLGILR